MNEELKHCCSHMDRYTVADEEDAIIEYDSDVRSYNFLLNEKGVYVGIRQQLWFCPWCGKKLPKDLGDEWEGNLKKDYNLTVSDFFDKQGQWDESKIPEEFRTDEWWKKRGL